MVSLRLIPITAFKHVYSRTSFSFSLGFSDSLTTQVQTEDTRVCPVKRAARPISADQAGSDFGYRLYPHPQLSPRPEFVEKASCAELLLCKHTSGTLSLVLTNSCHHLQASSKPREDKAATGCLFLVAAADGNTTTDATCDASRWAPSLPRLMPELAKFEL